MPPLIVFDPTAQQYVVMPKQPNNSVNSQKPTQISQQKPTKAPQIHNPQQQDHIPSPVTAVPPQSANAGQSVVVQQRNVSLNHRVYDLDLNLEISNTRYALVSETALVLEYLIYTHFWPKK